MRRNPTFAKPPRPNDFNVLVRVETYPGRHGTDVHLEGRGADVYFNYDVPADRIFGNWLFDFCVANCEMYKIQGVIFGERQWFSEMNHGRVFRRGEGDHNDHVHIELNYNGANLC